MTPLVNSLEWFLSTEAEVWYNRCKQMWAFAPWSDKEAWMRFFFHFFFCLFVFPSTSLEIFFLLYCLKFFSPFKYAPLIYFFLSFCPISFEAFFFSHSHFLLSLLVVSFHIILSLLGLPASPSSFSLLFSLWDRYISWKGVQNVSALGQLFNEKISFPSHVPIPLKPHAINANYSFA